MSGEAGGPAVSEWEGEFKEKGGDKEEEEERREEGRREGEEGG